VWTSVRLTSSSHAQKNIEERLLKGTEERSDMLSSFVRHGFSADELFHEAFTYILAGSDTAAAALHTLLLYLISHPCVYALLQTEIDGAVQAGKAPPPPGVIPGACAHSLPYHLRGEITNGRPPKDFQQQNATAGMPVTGYRRSIGPRVISSSLGRETPALNWTEAETF
jgi:cytochrome P450